VLALYMLLGLLFAFVYGAIDRLGDEPFFAGAPKVPQSSTRGRVAGAVDPGVGSEPERVVGFRQPVELAAQPAEVAAAERAESGIAEDADRGTHVVPDRERPADADHADEREYDRWRRHEGRGADESRADNAGRGDEAACEGGVTSVGRRSCRHRRSNWIPRLETA
jgi:hypothetical protein